MSTSQGSHRAARGGRRAATRTVEAPPVPPPSAPSIHEYETQPYAARLAPPPVRAPEPARAAAPVPAPAAGGRAAARRGARRRKAAP
ncbi:hypothetical protein AB0C77_14385, partial [Streptomyces sp. NPDC048629]